MLFLMEFKDNLSWPWSLGLQVKLFYTKGYFDCSLHGTKHVCWHLVFLGILYFSLYLLFLCRNSMWMLFGIIWFYTRAWRSTLSAFSKEDTFICAHWLWWSQEQIPEVPYYLHLCISYMCMHSVPELDGRLCYSIPSSCCRSWAGCCSMSRISLMSCVSTWIFVPCLFFHKPCIPLIFSATLT